MGSCSSAQSHGRNGPCCCSMQSTHHDQVYTQVNSADFERQAHGSQTNSRDGYAARDIGLLVSTTASLMRVCPASRGAHSEFLSTQYTSTSMRDALLDGRLMPDWRAGCARRATRCRYFPVRAGAVTIRDADGARRHRLSQPVPTRRCNRARRPVERWNRVETGD